jgi:hypothetical protein
LLYEQGFTISGARNRLDHRATVVAELDEERLRDTPPAIDGDKLRAGLLDILDLLKHGSQPAP